MQADAFASDVMHRIGVTPQALAFFFTATSWFEPVRGDFDTAAAYDAYRRQLQTHPLSAERLVAIATRMEKGAAGIARAEPQRTHAEQTIRRAGADIRKIGLELNDPKIREYQKYRGMRVDLNELRAIRR